MFGCFYMTLRMFAYLTVRHASEKMALYVYFDFLKSLQHLNLFQFRFTPPSLCYDSFGRGPIANQSLSFCLAVMHTNSQQHILISPESKAHQSQLTSPSDPARAILKKYFFLSVRHMWIWADDFAS